MWRTYLPHSGSGYSAVMHLLCKTRHVTYHHVHVLLAKVPLQLLRSCSFSSLQFQQHASAALHSNLHFQSPLFIYVKTDCKLYWFLLLLLLLRHHFLSCMMLCYYHRLDCITYFSDSVLKPFCCYPSSVSHKSVCRLCWSSVYSFIYCCSLHSMKHSPMLHFPSAGSHLIPDKQRHRHCCCYCCWCYCSVYCALSNSRFTLQTDTSPSPHT